MTDQSVRFCGCEESQNKDFSIEVTQLEFAAVLEVVKLPTQLMCDLSKELGDR